MNMNFNSQSGASVTTAIFDLYKESQMGKIE